MRRTDAHGTVNQSVNQSKSINQTYTVPHVPMHQSFVRFGTFDLGSRRRDRVHVGDRLRRWTRVCQMLPTRREICRFLKLRNTISKSVKKSNLSSGARLGLVSATGGFHRLDRLLAVLLQQPRSSLQRRVPTFGRGSRRFLQ